MSFTAATLAWWLAVFLVVPAPAATVALFAVTDPRRKVDPVGAREALAIVWRTLLRGWGLALLSVPVLAVLWYNLVHYAAGSSLFAMLVPLWMLLLVLGIAVTLAAFSVAALLDDPVLPSLKRGGLIVLVAPWRALLVVIVALILVVLCSILVVPLIFIPALLAALTNRFVLDTLGIAVFDPSAPTPERLEEERSRRAAARR